MPQNTNSHNTPGRQEKQRNQLSLPRQDECKARKDTTSRGTKVEKMLTLAPERYTDEFCMVAKVIQWCI